MCRHRPKINGVPISISKWICVLAATGEDNSMNVMLCVIHPNTYAEVCIPKDLRYDVDDTS